MYIDTVYILDIYVIYMLYSTCTSENPLKILHTSKHDLKPFGPGTSISVVKQFHLNAVSCGRAPAVNTVHE